MDQPLTFTLNGAPRRFDGDPDMPLLWHLREDCGLVGTKFGCGIGACGACTVHLDGQATRSCVLPMAAVSGRRITTIEGLGADGRMHPVQEAWIAEDVAQCGYCQAGQIMAAAALLAREPDPSDAAVEAAMTNLCRCGSYVRIRAAIALAAASKADGARGPAPR